MTDTPTLPPSLAVTPNIPFSEQTLEQLVQERDYWQAKIDIATGWGAHLASCRENIRACEQWIKRRQTP